MADRFDAIVIGAGAGGLTVGLGLAALGRSVALVEADRVGGDCTNTGCVPSKRLIHLARHQPSDAQAIFADVRRTRDELAGRERDEMDRIENLTFIAGRATFQTRSTLTVDTKVGTRVISAANIVIATGSRPIRLTIDGLPAARTLTNESVFEITSTPRHLAIIGAGAIGLELAAAFNRLGTKVTMVDLADRVLVPAIPEASQTVAAALAEREIATYLRSKATRYDDATSTLTLDTPDGDVAVDGVDAVLLAVGRVPNIDQLNLDAAGVAHTRGIVVDSWGRTSVKGIWAVGDATVGSNQTHAANALGRRVVQRIAFPWMAFGRPPLLPAAVFCEPEVAWVGMSSGEVAKRVHPRMVRTIRVDLGEIDRSLTDAVSAGFVSITARRLTGRILGATIVGPHAAEIVATLTQAIEQGVSLFRLSRRAYAYPTFTSILGKAGDVFTRSTLTNLKTEISVYLRFRFRRGERTTTP